MEDSPGNWDGQNKLIFNTSLNSIISGLKVAGILIILMLLESTQLKVQAVRTNGCFQGSEAASDWFKDFRVRYSVILHFTDALVYTNLFFYFNNLT